MLLCRILLSSCSMAIFEYCKLAAQKCIVCVLSIVQYAHTHDRQIHKFSVARENCTCCCSLASGGFWCSVLCQSMFYIVCQEQKAANLKMYKINMSTDCFCITRTQSETHSVRHRAPTKYQMHLFFSLIFFSPTHHKHHRGAG